MSRFAGTRFRWVLAGVLGVLIAAPVIASSLNDALQGTSGTPSNTNRFVTNADPRLSGGSGTVTSVGLTTPAEFSVAGSPVTTNGTLAVTKATQTANTVWAGPTSGSAAQPTFRALVTADLLSPLAGMPLWMPPTTADPRNDEFTDSALTGWTIGASGVTTAIDAYATIASGASWRYNATTYRPSWLMIQMDNAATYRTIITKGVSLGTNEMIFFRAFSSRRGNSASNDGGIGILLSATSGGLPDPANSIELYASESDGTTAEVQFSKVTGGGAGVDIAKVSQSATANDFEYFLLSKRGTTYDAWCANATGQWRWMGTSTHATAFDRITVVASNNSASAPGNIITGFDFIRFNPSATQIP
jgi:hypothetical protein